MPGRQKEEALLFDLGGVLVDLAGFEVLPLLLQEKPTSRIAYFDDTPVNVEAAAEAGMTAFHVRGLAELTQTLRQFGVLPD